MYNTVIYRYEQFYEDRILFRVTDNDTILSNVVTIQRGILGLQRGLRRFRVLYL